MLNYDNLIGIGLIAMNMIMAGFLLTSGQGNFALINEGAALFVATVWRWGSSGIRR